MTRHFIATVQTVGMICAVKVKDRRIPKRRGNRGDTSVSLLAFNLKKVECSLSTSSQFLDPNYGHSCSSLGNRQSLHSSGYLINYHSNKAYLYRILGTLCGETTQ